MGYQGVFSEMFKEVITTLEQKLAVCFDPEEKVRLKKRLRYLKRKYAPKPEKEVTEAVHE